MAQDLVVTLKAESGQRLVEALEAAAFPVSVAFWAKVAESERWRLHIASPLVGRDGAHAAYMQLIHLMGQNIPGVWLEPEDVRLLDEQDSLALAAVGAARPPPFPGMTHFTGGLLSNYNLEEAYIYPSHHTATAD